MSDLPTGVTEILVTPQFHYDIAYLQTDEGYYPRCWENLREAARMLEAYPEYRYMVEQPYLLDVLREREPDLFARFQAAHQRGQMEIGGALWCIPDMNMPSGESLLRQVRRGQRFAREWFGAEVRVAWIADTWGHPATMPGILAHAGVTAYFFTRAMRPDFERGDFLWTGLDGTAMPAHWLPGGYGTLRFPDADVENVLELSLSDATDANLRALAEKYAPYLAQPTLLLCSGGDMARPAASAPAVVAGWQARGLPVRFGHIGEYAARLHAAVAKLPGFSGDFNPLMTGTQGTRIALKLWNRRLEGEMQSTERLDAARRLAGSAPAILPDLDRAERLLLKNQFHDILSGTLVDAAWRTARDEYRVAFADVEAARAAFGPPTHLFNPCAFPRTEWAAAADGTGDMSVTVPALGWVERPATAVPASEERVADDEPIRLENEFWSVTVAPSGLLSSVVDRATRSEFVAPGGPGWGDLVYRNDNGDLWLLDRSPLDGGSYASHHIEAAQDDPYRPYQGSRDPFVNDDPIGQNGRVFPRLIRRRTGETSLVTRGAVGFWRNRIEFEKVITLRDDDPLIRLHLTVRPSGRRYRLYLCFPTPWPEARLRHEIAFGAVERAEGDGSRYVVQNWAEAVSLSGAGVRLLNAGTPGHAVGGGVLSVLLLRSVAMEYKAESVEAYEEGTTHEFDFAVRPFADEPREIAVREGAAFNLPLVPTGAGDLVTGGDTPLLTLTPDNIHLSALYTLPNGDLLVRVYECAGRSATGELKLAAGIRAACISDGQEGEGEPLALTADEALRFTLRPWQVASWRVRPGH